MGKNSEIWKRWKPIILMIFVQFTYCGMNIFYKIAANDGMNLRVIVAYRWIFGAAFVVPIALILERNKRPKLTWVVVGQAFLCALFGGTGAQNFYLEGLVLTSATFTCAVTNLIPAFTLILATSLGIEKLKVKTIIGQAKILGTIVGIGGTMVLTFYKGIEIKFMPTKIHILKPEPEDGQLHHNNNNILGYAMALACCVSTALWLIVQSKMSKRYPCPYSSTALFTTMAAIQCTIVSISIERNWSMWKLGWNIRLLTTVYSGVVTSGISTIIMIWSVSERGPVFVSSFNPLNLVLVAIAGSLLLEEILHLGSILGSVMIICGLYIMLWGQNKELKVKAAGLMKTESLPTSNLAEIATNGDDLILSASSTQLSIPKDHQDPR